MGSIYCVGTVDKGRILIPGEMRSGMILLCYSEWCAIEIGEFFISNIIYLIFVD